MFGRLDTIVLNVDTGDPGRAVSRRDKPGQEPHRRRLARAVRPEKRHDLPLRNRKRHVPNGQKRPKLLAQPIGFDHDGL